jgi:hypothetical protein
MMKKNFEKNEEKREYIYMTKNYEKTTKITVQTNNSTKVSKNNSK